MLILLVVPKVHDDELREQVAQQLLQQLDFIFPDGLVSGSGTSCVLTRLQRVSVRLA